MREKYESLALVDLKEIAKARGMKGTSGMKKAEIIEAMLLEDEKEKDMGDRQAPAADKPVRARKTAAKHFQKNPPEEKKGSGESTGGTAAPRIQRGNAKRGRAFLIR